MEFSFNPRRRKAEGRIHPVFQEDISGKGVKNGQYKGKIRGMGRIANLKMLFLVDCFVSLWTKRMRGAEIQEGGWSDLGKGDGKSWIGVPYPIRQQIL